ncbi:hypothetical protein VM1G_07085 [Cytospora mali]|uniref:Protein THEM6 n=1 Tax=Cytospora mali TaxID=578113 RepID=A0A194W493_CYTMA|nr:hypothetical protein VM1G_07085 [Valsa mali]
MNFVTSPAIGLALSLAAIYLFKLSPIWSATVVFLSLNLKMLPLVSTVRVAPALARLFLWPTSTPEPESLLQSHSMGSRTCILECDVNIHKSNSTYLLDLDVSRAELLTRRFAHALRRTRGALILAGVNISFRREIKPLQAYETRSCVLAWDQKWIYVLSCHIKPGAAAMLEAGSDDWVGALMGNSESPHTWKSQVFAVAVSKYVAKAGRRTIPPSDLLEAGGYLGSGGPADKERLDRVEARRLKGLDLVAFLSSN